MVVAIYTLNLETVHPPPIVPAGELLESEYAAVGGRNWIGMDGWLVILGPFDFPWEH